MEKLNKITSYTGNPVSSFDEIPVVHIIREEETSPGNRRIGDDVSNPYGRSDANGILSKASAAHLSKLRSSTKRRWRRKRILEQKRRRVKQVRRRGKGNKSRKLPSPTIRNLECTDHDTGFCRGGNRCDGCQENSCHLQGTYTWFSHGS